MFAFVRKNLSGLVLKFPQPIACRSRSPVSFSFSFQFSSSSTETHRGISPALFDILVDKYEFSPGLASRVVSEASGPKNPEKADSILSFFKESGFSNTQLEKIVKFRPRYLSASLEGCIKPKFKILQDEGFSSDDITKIISTTPKILHSSMENNIIPSLSVLKSLLGSSSEVAKVIRCSQRLLRSSFQKTVLPNVEILKSCGIPMDRICVILRAYPCCFAIRPEFMRKCAERAIKMGVHTNSRNFIYAIPTMAKMGDEAWELKLQAFRDMGFSDTEILTMFRKTPRVFYASIEKLNKVKELLLSTGKYNISSIVNCPSSFYCSIQKRFIPRLEILRILGSKNLIQEWPSLGTICSLTDVQFSDRFIRPYLDEVSDVYGRKSSAVAKRG